MSEALVNQEMEAALLGAVLGSTKTAEEASFLEPTDFAYELHQTIWAELCRRLAAGESTAPLVIATALHEHLIEHGGVRFLNRLCSLIIAPPTVSAWAREIKSLSLRRKVMAILDDRKLQFADTGKAETPEEIIADLMSDLERATANSAPRVKTERQTRHEEMSAMGKPIVCYSTGFRCLDEAMAGGLHAGKAYGIFARMKAGKTLVAGQISHHLNREGTKNLYIACEMGAAEIEHRAMAEELEVNSLAFVDDRYRQNPGFVARVGEAAIKSPGNLLYLDAPGLTFDQLRRDVTHAILAHGAKGFILDYLQLVGGQRKGQTKAEFLDEICQWIAEVVRKRKVFALVLGQMNQEGNTRGGEGVRLAFDQVYELRREQAGNGAWFEMMVTRYTKWADIGSEITPALYLDQSIGPRFTEGQGSIAA